MEARYEIDRSKGIVLAIMAGECTLDVRKAIWTEYSQDPDVDGLNILIDMRDCAYTLSPDEVREERRHMAQFSKLDGRKIAIIVGRDLQYGMNRLAASVLEGPDVEARPFRDYDEALDWVLS